MRLTDTQIGELTLVYKQVHGKTLSHEEAQAVGLAIMRLVYVKKLRKHQLTTKENENERN